MYKSVENSNSQASDEFVHISVLLDECIEGLNIKPDGIYADLTAGGGGHSKNILNRLSKSGVLIAVDQDPTAISVLEKRLGNNKNCLIVNSNFNNIDSVLQDKDINKVDGILLDLGVSSHQLDNGDRGFSYNHDALLDMRMSQSGFSAYDLINTYDKEKIASVLFTYGEEKFANRIASNIINARQDKDITTTFELVEIIKKSYPSKAKRDKHPAKKTFQAIRIAVNGELDNLVIALDKSFEALKSGGRMCVITFHSLEDRIVKHSFIKKATNCVCPKEFPICVCGGDNAIGKIITKKPILPTNEEIERNSRSKSAKLRIIEKL